MKDAIQAVLVMAVFVLATGQCAAQQEPKVRHCIHGMSGEVIAVRAGQACPAGYRSL